MSAGVRRSAALSLLGVVCMLALFAAPAAADDGWIIERFASDIEIQKDGALLITEAIDVPIPRWSASTSWTFGRSGMRAGAP